MITSYALLRIDFETLNTTSWDLAILDEAQAIKNPESQVASAAHRLSAKRRIALSGTPVENRLEERWSILHFLNPGVLGSRKDFQERYVGPMRRGDDEVAARLRRRTGPFVLRRLKSEVAPELPPRTDVILQCTLSDSERALYDAIRVASQKEVVSELKEGKNILKALESLLRLRQAACHPGLVPGQEADSSSKLALLTNKLASMVPQGHKALVFSQWTSLLDRVEPALNEADIDFVRLDGSTKDRGAVVDQFQAANGPPVILLSLKAGGTGLNLTAADHVFLMDPWWNPAVEDQAADRAHRIGQDKPVMVYKMVAHETVEDRIIALQERKRALAAAAVGDGAGAAGGITKEDLLALLT